MKRSNNHNAGLDSLLVISAWTSALKGQNIIAQGIALGLGPNHTSLSPERAEYLTFNPTRNVHRIVPLIFLETSLPDWMFTCRISRPFRARGLLGDSSSQGYALGYDIAPLQGNHMKPLETKSGATAPVHLLTSE